MLKAAGRAKESAKPGNRRKAVQPVRQSVTIPARLAREVERLARKDRMSRSKAIVLLAERGVQARRDNERRLEESYRRFMAEADPKQRAKEGDELIRAVFGDDAIAPDTIR